MTKRETMHADELHMLVSDRGIPHLFLTEEDCRSFLKYARGRYTYHFVAIHPIDFTFSEKNIWAGTSLRDLYMKRTEAEKREIAENEVIPENAVRAIPTSAYKTAIRELARFVRPVDIEGMSAEVRAAIEQSTAN